MYDIIIIGAGPAGLTAAIYARRAEKSVLVIEKSTFGGQITHSPRIENYPGFVSLSGSELGEKLIEQALTLGAEIELDEVLKVEGDLNNYKVICEHGEFSGKTIIIATGSHHRTLGLLNEEKFVGEGISYCAVCDGAFYRDKTVAVIGGGNTALQEAVMLSDICKKIHIVQNLDFLTGEQSLISEIEKRDNVEVILSSTVSGIIGEDEFSGIIIDNGNETKELLIDGMFVAIGQKPENEPFSDITKLDDAGYIISGEDCLPKTSKSGIFTAGDCRTKGIRQVATAVADGATAAISACRLIDSL